MEEGPKLFDHLLVSVDIQSEASGMRLGIRLFISPWIIELG